MVEMWGLPGGTVEAKAGIRLVLSTGKRGKYGPNPAGCGNHCRGMVRVLLQADQVVQDKLMRESAVGNLLGGLRCPPCAGQIL